VPRSACRFVIDEIIEPMGHRQLVFVLPKHLRRPFYRDRKLLAGLCRAAEESTHAFYRAGLGQDNLRVRCGAGRREGVGPLRNNSLMLRPATPRDDAL
jgi:hypothetical protein